MLHALQLTIQRHEATFGVLETDVQKRVQPGVMRAQQQAASPNPTLPKIAEAQYTVQITSLEEKAKADKVVKELEEDGYSAYIREREVNGKTYYRVNCGIFTRKGAAEDHAEELFKKRGGDKGLVMKLSVNHE